jgi:hypothetical protein
MFVPFSAAAILSAWCTADIFSAAIKPIVIMKRDVYGRVIQQATRFPALIFEIISFLNIFS